jgi:hypothetical protein
MLDPLTVSTCCSLNSEDVSPVVSCAGRWLCEVSPDTATAETVAGFIRRRFQVAYGARPALRIPTLLALTSSQDALLAAVGIRNAARERLFLEDYLRGGVEALIPAAGLDRRRIAEIAHLAGVEAGISQYLFASLAVWLKAERYEWVVFTGTDQLRNSFRRAGIEPQVLAVADPACLSDGGIGWGRYYDHHPMVMAVNVATSKAILQKAGLLANTSMVVANPNANTVVMGDLYGFSA